MSEPTLPSFRYRLEQQPPYTGCGGLVRGASVRQFPVSQGIGGASMRLQPGCLRELHWHTTAAELGYVVSGSCRTTVLSPDGAATDTFGPGDVWYFPSGWGHSILGIGSIECHFILIFDDGAFAEEHTLSITDWFGPYVTCSRLTEPRPRYGVGGQASEGRGLLCRGTRS